MKRIKLELREYVGWLLILVLASVDYFQGDNEERS
jgi:hypothetical protein